MESAKLRGEVGEELRRGGFRVVDCGRVAVVVEVAGADKAVAAWQLVSAKHAH